jgi:HSP20 family molecular chaperone IbpA
MGISSVSLEDCRCTAGTHGGKPSGKHTVFSGRYIWIRETHVWRPPTDVWETDRAIQVRVEAAGMEESDFAIVLEGSRLRISGIRPAPPVQAVYHQLEIRAGEFQTEVELPCRLEPSSIKAQYHDGFLVVNILKSAACGDAAG